MDAMMHSPVRPREKRYGWFRLYHDFTGHPNWRLVTVMTGLDIGNVEAVLLRLYKCASKARPRGTIADFSCNACAADLGVDPAKVVAVYRQLEAMGYIDQEYLVHWDERQPDQEDPTAAKRQQRRRDRIRAERQESSRVTPVTDRDCHTQDLDEDKKKKRKRAPSVSPDQRTMPLCVVVSSTPPPEQAAPQMASSGKKDFEASPQLRAILAKQGG
jgi:hypothetical protein